MFGHSTCGIEHVIVVATLTNPWTFSIAIFVFYIFVALFHIGSAEAFNTLFDAFHFATDRYHIIVKTGTVEMRIAPIEVCLTIGIYQNRGVYIVPRTVIE